MRVFLAAGAVAVCTASVAVANPVEFYGIDPGNSSQTQARPNSDAAQARFLSAIGNSTTIDYESLADTGWVSTLNVGSGASLNTTDGGGGTRGPNFISIDSSRNNAVDGFGLGANARKMWVGAFRGTNRSFTMTFSSAISAFGTYIGGLGTAGGSTLMIEYQSSAGTRSFELTGDAAGGILFFGFTDFGETITEITFTQNNGDDGFMFDNTSFGDALTVIPLPSAAGIGMAGLGLLGLRRRRA